MFLHSEMSMLHSGRIIYWLDKNIYELVLARAAFNIIG